MPVRPGASSTSPAALDDAVLQQLPHAGNEFHDVKREPNGLNQARSDDAGTNEDEHAGAIVPDCWSLLHTLPLPPRAKWTRRLVITKQPASEFYKDEGASVC